MRDSQRFSFLIFRFPKGQRIHHSNLVLGKLGGADRFGPEQIPTLFRKNQYVSKNMFDLRRFACVLRIRGSRNIILTKTSNFQHLQDPTIVQFRFL